MLQSEIDKYIARMEKEGMSNAKEIVDFVRTKYAEYSKKYPSRY